MEEDISGGVGGKSDISGGEYSSFVESLLCAALSGLRVAVAPTSLSSVAPVLGDGTMRRRIGNRAERRDEELADTPRQQRVV